MAICVLVALPFGSAHAQLIPYYTVVGEIEDTPVLASPVAVPDFNPQEEQVLFSALRLYADTADVPFFIDRTGTAVPRAQVDAYLAEHAKEDEVYFVCDVPMGDGETLDMNDPVSRRDNCMIR